MDSLPLYDTKTGEDSSDSGYKGDDDSSQTVYPSSTATIASPSRRRGLSTTPTSPHHCAAGTNGVDIVDDDPKQHSLLSITRLISFAKQPLTVVSAPSATTLSTVRHQYRRRFSTLRPRSSSQSAASKTVSMLLILAVVVSLLSSITTTTRQIFTGEASGDMTKRLRSGPEHRELDTLPPPSFGFMVEKHQSHPRIVFFDGEAWSRSSSSYSTVSNRNDVNLTLNAGDETRLYSVMDSADAVHMEKRIWPEHEFDSKCKPMADWQSSMFPVCNDVHAQGLLVDNIVDDRFSLLSSKGFWRHAWKYNSTDVGRTTNTTTVWRTFK